MTEYQLFLISRLKPMENARLECENVSAHMYGQNHIRLTIDGRIIATCHRHILTGGWEIHVRKITIPGESIDFDYLHKFLNMVEKCIDREKTTRKSCKDITTRLY